MSVYTRFPLPLIAYTIVHRPQQGIPREQYETTLLEMHSRVEGESSSFGEDQEKTLAGISARQAQILRGALSQFLQTPIRSDDDEVRKIFQDGFAELLQQASESGPYGAIVSWAGRAESPAGSQPLVKRLEANGRRYLRSLGVGGGKTPSEVYESVYVVRGGMNMDVLEHIVRDRIGIYESPHGEHIRQASPFVVAVHNLVHASGAEYWRSLAASRCEAVLFFEKPALPYDQFRAALTSVIDASLSGSAAATLWQRKLGLGRGCEFALRFLLSRKGDLPALIKRLGEAAGAGKEFALRDAHLLVKDLLHPGPA